MRQGEVWLTTLDPTVGREIQKTRPCLIISPPDLNDYLRTVVVIPMTTGSRPTSFRVPVRFSGKEGLILLDQLRSVDKARLVKRLGAIQDEVLAATLSKLRDMFEP